MMTLSLTLKQAVSLTEVFQDQTIDAPNIKRLTQDERGLCLQAFHLLKSADLSSWDKSKPQNKMKKADLDMLIEKIERMDVPPYEIVEGGMGANAKYIYYRFCHAVSLGFQNRYSRIGTSFVMKSISAYRSEEEKAESQVIALQEKVNEVERERALLKEHIKQDTDVAESIVHDLQDLWLARLHMGARHFSEEINRCTDTEGLNLKIAPKNLPKGERDQEFADKSFKEASRMYMPKKREKEKEFITRKNALQKMQRDFDSLAQRKKKLSGAKELLEKKYQLGN